MSVAHKGLQFLTAKTIKKMPEPVQNVTYRAAWLPINAVRGVKNAALSWYVPFVGIDNGDITARWRCRRLM